ncbi:MAG: DUF3644 domain-containing protein [SAR324 cluster bacterium]|nr:DUF3644 domain-containing protein [SAR324 cluster bacterium]
MDKRKRRVGAIKIILLKKSKQAALTAVQTFNNPNIKFKSEAYIVLIMIAWRYLLHAYFKKNKIDYRCVDKSKSERKRRIFYMTKTKKYKYWGLRECLEQKGLPLDKGVVNNLNFLIGLRNEIEHHISSTSMDNRLFNRFQPCCVNYNKYIKKWFGEKHGMEKYLSTSLQFSPITMSSIKGLGKYEGLEGSVLDYAQGFDENLTPEERKDVCYVQQVYYEKKLANNKNEDAEVIVFIPEGSPLANGLDGKEVVLRDTEKYKFIPSQIVSRMQGLGYDWFCMHQHTKLWQKKDAKNLKHGYGILVVKQWYWYNKWVNEVEKHCKKEDELREEGARSFKRYRKT